MRKNVNKIIQRILALLEEAESYEFYRGNLLKSIDQLFQDYQEGRYTHAEYQKLLDDVLKGKSKEDWVKYYSSYIYSVFKHTEPLLSQIIYLVYNDHSISKLKAAEEVLAEAKPEKAKAVVLEEDKRHELEKIKEREGRRVEEFVEFETEPLIGKPVSPLRERFAEDIGKIRKERERNKRVIKVELPEMLQGEKEKKPSFFYRISADLRHYLEKKRMHKKKEYISKELARIHKGPVSSKIAKFFGRLRPERGKKPMPVVVKQPSLFARISGSIKPWFAGKKKPELKPFKKPRIKPGLKAKAAKPGIFAAFLGSIAQRIESCKKHAPKQAYHRLLEAKVLAPKPQKAKPEGIALKKDRDLERLITKLDDINKSITELRVEEPKKSLKMRLDLSIIRLHTAVRHALVLRKEKIVARVPEGRVEAAEERPEEIRIKLPEIKVVKPEEKIPEKEFVLSHVFREAYSKVQPILLGIPQKLASSAGKLKSVLYIEKRKPAEKERAPELLRAPASVKKENSFDRAYARIKGLAVRTTLPARLRIQQIKSYLFLPVEKPKPAPEIKRPEIKEKIAVKPAAPPAAKEPEIRFRFSWSSMKESYSKMMEREKKFISREVAVTPSLQMQALKEKIRPLSEEEKITPRLLKEEVDSIRKIIEGRKRYKIYQPSFIGSFANATIRKFTFYLIERYPAFFKTLYDNLRLANITVLSNTYVNIMLLTTIVVSALSSLFFFAFFLFTNNPLILVIPKTLMMMMLAGGVTFLVFYSYPQMKASSREASINTNLPFAINHISAVAGSGVPPTKMFRLIIESEEYGEIAVEIEKIVEYVELFGYDLLTAVRSVALTTPSIPFKEFLEGMVSTIESGGDLNVYLREKTSEAILNYELDRQKYTETISTYSDVYTGILIAAPLFFIVALSLVSMLGGSVAGLDVGVLIIVGAYVVIPALNIIFIIILDLTQPKM